MQRVSLLRDRAPSRYERQNRIEVTLRRNARSIDTYGVAVARLSAEPAALNAVKF